MNPVVQAERVIAGHCAACGAVLVVLNNHEVWPWVVCSCGHGCDTHGIADAVRLEREWRPNSGQTDLFDGVDTT